jgi:hypothetical protein
MFKYIQTFSNEHMRYLAKMLSLKDSQENPQRTFSVIEFSRASCAPEE